MTDYEISAELGTSKTAELQKKKKFSKFSPSFSLSLSYTSFWSTQKFCLKLKTTDSLKSLLHMQKWVKAGKKWKTFQTKSHSFMKARRQVDSRLQLVKLKHISRQINAYDLALSAEARKHKTLYLFFAESRSMSKRKCCTAKVISLIWVQAWKNN